MKRLLLLALCLGFLNAQAQDFRKKAPAPGPAPRIQMGNYETFKLDNGLQVIVVENHKLPLVSVSLTVDMGPVMEKETAGAANIAGSLLERGSKKRTKAQIDTEVDFIGASLSTSSGGFFGNCLKKHVNKLMDIASDIVLNPTFPKEEFEKIKKQTLSGLATQRDNAEAMGRNVASVLRNGTNHPYGEITSEVSVKKVTLENCKNFYNTYFKPNISYLTIVGDVNTAEAKALAQQYFGEWKKGDVKKLEPAMPKAPEKAQVAFVQKNGAVQSFIDITHPVDLKPNDPDVIKATLANRILGAGGFSARLFQNLREAKAYTYGAYSQLNTDPVVGSFSASASVRNVVTDSAVMAFLYELRRMSTEKVSDQELQTVKNVTTGSFARSLEEPRTIANFALNIARYNLPKDYYNTYLEKVNSVTVDDVMAMSKKYIRPDNAYILVVGSKDDVSDKLKQFAPDGKVHFYDMYGNPVEYKNEAAPAGLTGEAVIEKYLAAIGGREKLMAVKDISRVMESEMMGRVMEMSMYQKAPNKFSNTMSMGGMVLSKQVFDGKKGSVSSMGQNKEMEGDELKDMEEESKMFSELYYKDKKYKMNLKGSESIEGKSAYKVEVESPTGSKTLEFYDVETGLKMREIKTIGQGERTATMTNDYKEYKEVNGIKMPHVMEVSGMAPVPIVMKAKEIKVNSNLSDNVFKAD